MDKKKVRLKIDRRQGVLTPVHGLKLKLTDLAQVMTPSHPYGLVLDQAQTVKEIRVEQDAEGNVTITLEDE